MERISYRGWPNCWRLANDQVSLIVTADVGPRIISFSHKEDDNEFFEVHNDAGKSGGPEFRMYGGHRFWIAPETAATAYPDNVAVTVDALPHGAIFSSPTESTGIQKQLAIELAAANEIKVTHRVTNRSDHPVHLAPWALTVLRAGGEVILPLPTRAPHGPAHLLPTSSLALWSYTDLSAPCWRVGPEYLRLDQRLAASVGFGMQKVGVRNPSGWGAYLRNGHLFVKAAPCKNASYPDFGSNFETFANEDFIELETLGPEEEISPGATIEHTEHWGLWIGVTDNEELTDALINDRIKPKALSLVARI